MRKLIFRSILLLTAVLSFYSTHAGMLTLSGIYLGKNIYVQNSFARNMKDFCCNDVYVNDVKIVMNVNVSAFEVDLSHLKLNDPVTIKITHKDDCKPKILNAQIIRASCAFQFSTFDVESKKIEWATSGEKIKGVFYVEHYTNNAWKVIKEIAGQGSIILNNYNVESAHQPGLNKYRVKYLESDGQVFYSDVLSYKAP
jgi:hypothetical protein